MAKKPDLDDLTVPKGDDAPAGQPRSEAPAGETKTLSYRMSPEQYRRLRQYVRDVEAQTGKRITHQAVIDEAVEDFLKRKGA
jgi:hypothetical protein